MKTYQEFKEAQQKDIILSFDILMVGGVGVDIVTKLKTFSKVFKKELKNSNVKSLDVGKIEKGKSSIKVMSGPVKTAEARDFSVFLRLGSNDLKNIQNIISKLINKTNKGQSTEISFTNIIKREENALSENEHETEVDIIKTEFDEVQEYVRTNTVITSDVESRGYVIRMMVHETLPGVELLDKSMRDRYIHNETKHQVFKISEDGMTIVHNITNNPVEWR